MSTMDTGYDMHPAKRRKMSHLPPREIGIMRKSHQENGSATFLGSSSGIYFIRVVYNAFARRSAYLNQAQQSAPKDNLVPGEDDQLQRQSPRHDAAQALRNELWMPHELDHHRAPKFNFDNLVRWTRSYFDHWHPIFPYILGPTFLRTLEQLNSSNGWSKLTSAETILVRSVISISLLDRRQMNTSTATRTKGIPVPAMLVFRTVDQAMQSLHALFCDPPTVPLLQAAFSVQIFLVSLLRLNAASRLGGVITRTAFHLGLHRCPARYSCFAPDEVTIRRRLFWSIYCLERYLSQALGIPLSIRDDDVDVCYPGMETHDDDHVPDGHLRLLTHLAKFARVRGLIVELRNKCFAHAQEPSSTATQINGELAQWWNEVYEDVYLDLDTEEVREEHAPAFSQSHRLLLIVLRHESIISMNRPLLAADQTAPEYKTALQICIESSRSLIAELRRSLPPSTTGVPPIWPSFTWAVWMSCLILIYAAWEGEFAVSAASRYTKSGLLILQNLALRGSAWPQTCIEALQDLESALSSPTSPPPLQQQQPPVCTATQGQQQLSTETDSALGISGENNAPVLTTDPTIQQFYNNPSVIFGDTSNNTFLSGFSADGLLPGDSGVENVMSDLWTVADGPWLIQENYGMNGFL